MQHEEHQETDVIGAIGVDVVVEQKREEYDNDTYQRRPEGHLEFFEASLAKHILVGTQNGIEAAPSDRQQNDAPPEIAVLKHKVDIVKTIVLDRQLAVEKKHSPSHERRESVPQDIFCCLTSCFHDSHFTFHNLQHHQFNVVNKEVAALALVVEDSEMRPDVRVVVKAFRPQGADVDINLLPATFRLAVDSHMRVELNRPVLIGGILEFHAEIEVAPIIHLQIHDGLRVVDSIGCVGGKPDVGGTLGHTHNAASVAAVALRDGVETVAALHRRVERYLTRARLEELLPQDLHQRLGDIACTQCVEVRHRVGSKGHVGKVDWLIVRI